MFRASPSPLLRSLSSATARGFPHRFAHRRSPRRPDKVVLGKAASFRSAAALPDDFSDEEFSGETGGKSGRRGVHSYLNLMEVSCVHADKDTYALLLDVCFNRGLLVDAKRVHGKVVKLGFDMESAVCDKLIGIYLNFGEFRDALTVFDAMPFRTFHSWNHVISMFLSKKWVRDALDYFSRMLVECEEYGEMPDPVLFATVLKACSGYNILSRYMEQLHGKIIRYGFNGNSVVGNPLVDFYAKNGCPDSAWSVFEELSSRDHISWVAMISGFAQNGFEKEAILLFSEMCQSGGVPTTYALSSVLSACTKGKYFDQGKQIHAKAFKWGLWCETYVCNALVSLYSRCGRMGVAEGIFRRMSRPDGITYNSLISGHAQIGNGESALRLFRDMQVLQYKPDCVTVASLLSACATVGATLQGQQLHSYVLKAGFSLDLIIEGSLLDFYANCFDAETTLVIFNETLKQNIVLWNVMLMAYGRLGQLKESFDLFSQMQIVGIKPNQYTYPSILRTCTLLGALHLGELIHGLVVKSGFEFNVYVSSVLIDMYSKCGRLESARGILKRLTEKDVVSWTAMIAGYAQHELYFEALSTFEEMLKQGIQSDNIGLSSALSACGGIQAIEQGLQIHAKSVISGYSKDLSIGNALVSLYARCGHLKDAYSTFENIEKANEVSWNGLISGFAQSGHTEEALKVFIQMIRAGVEPNLFTFGSSISASADLADVKQGMQIHARMIKTGYDTEIEMGNALITLYSKCGIVEDAEMEFSLMAEKNEVTWNAMITGYSQHGRGDGGLKLFQQMKQESLKPNHVTFVSVLSACSHVGFVTEALDHFKSMSEEHGILPKPEHYACMVDILGRAGQLDQARQFIMEMPICPDAMVWKTLLSACRVHKNTDMGEYAARHLLELEPHDSATYVLLSNIYAVTKKWDSRDKIRKMMKDKAVKKEPGRSWIEVKNSIHAFFVSDKLHPRANEIYMYLEELNERAAQAGYIQDKESLLHDIEQEKKDPNAYTHSEKLAVAFGLISLSAGMPIRVIKNLRVCNDCHTWMKFVSRITGRFVTVRDASRFHHFKDGCCSCGDFW